MSRLEDNTSCRGRGVRGDASNYRTGSIYDAALPTRRVGYGSVKSSVSTCNLLLSPGRGSLTLGQFVASALPRARST